MRFKMIAAAVLRPAPLLLLLSMGGAVKAGDDPGKNLLSGLRAGGYVILMRHASSPATLPDATQAEIGNRRRERQLDEAGRAAAREFGMALRRLGIPIGHVLSSPTYRALETIRLANLGEPKTFAELGDNGQSMLSDTSGNRAAWLEAKAAEPPLPGTNTIIVTHLPNIVEAFPQSAAGLADGEAVILHSDRRGDVIPVARLKIGDWSKLGP